MCRYVFLFYFLETDSFDEGTGLNLPPKLFFHYLNVHKHECCITILIPWAMIWWKIWLQDGLDFTMCFDQPRVAPSMIRCRGKLPRDDAKDSVNSATSCGNFFHYKNQVFAQGILLIYFVKPSLLWIISDWLIWFWEWLKVFLNNTFKIKNLSLSAEKSSESLKAI